MNNKLYVGGLSYSSTEAGIRNLFAASGSVHSVAIITDRDTGQSKGFGFVEMASPAEAQAAINALDGRDFDGRRLMVSEAKAKNNSR